MRCVPRRECRCRSSVRAIADGCEVPWDGCPWESSKCAARGSQPSITTLRRLRSNERRWMVSQATIATIDEAGYVKSPTAQGPGQVGRRGIRSVDLECALVSHKAVQEAAVIAVDIPNGRAAARGRRFKAAKKSARSAERASRELRVVARPASLDFVAEIPRTSTAQDVES